MKVTNVVKLPFKFTVGGTNTDSKKSLFSRIFAAEDSKEKETEIGGAVSLVVSGELESTSECDMSVQEMKELFAEHKEALGMFVDGTYKKAAKEIGAAMAEGLRGFVSELAAGVPDGATVVGNVFDNAYNLSVAYRNYEKKISALDEEDEKAKTAKENSDEEVLEGMRNEIRRDLKKGYTYEHDSNVKAAEEGNEKAKLYLKLEAEIIKSLSDTVDAEE